MPEYIEIDILKEECFVCFDSSDNEYIKLTCCNRSNIHKKCLFGIFINFINLKSSIITCPLCRQDICIKDYFTLDDAITLFSNQENKFKIKFLNKFNAIITHNYMEPEPDTNTNNINIDETTSISISQNQPAHKKYAFTMVVFICLVVLIIGLRFIPS
jgi:hypothetical protein